MSKIKIGINGFGRIGRNVFKLAEERSNMEVVGINDLTDTKTLAHLLKYDSTQGKFNGDVSFNENSLIVNGKEIRVTAERLPIDIKWAETPDVVVEATGIFRSKESNKGGYGDHLKTGAKKVILTVPAKDQIDRMIVLGVNDDELQDDDQCVSNASCTTNCLAPIAKVLNDRFGIESGLMTTIHAYTNDQSILDAPHSDLRRARSAAVSQIPTTTGAAKAVGKVIPELNGKMDGMAIRIPTPTGSLVDLVVNLKTEASKDEINAAMKEAAEGPMKGILEYQEDPIVSVDIIHNTHSSIYDKESLMIQGKTVKVLAWYDNEWGYSCRVVDLIDLFNL
ncbi:MAG: type I glyceraldehyde-3-phosphate dehydrogenase [Lentimicrobiaceae bacterium]|jgi:glyceraldehyde 3-phosphate dehydrogenase|nr:type I glyceraldehyde-3-phosphate dehydrogenase [Lentimicrobiaceae bacterium]MBT3453739.1 type I glyceraldehyde-3-phosphate dehydrogenase [Lentimicrobiaceae bacterium]MBT3819536.1 type I glyceraldehyde-3-phosphate dehydrogenase [Lentimicrobiaceae bacterium]MBT4061677.1 type I glyceraldehyde-3-phosphate dehydrogenase [Lentimicrobiaceae bacterium]MBT4190230.1 type I glyceraldehyde-3-phosphate dehydrogenase [Lentimicrobiaceae bacterium]